MKDIYANARYILAQDTANKDAVRIGKLCCLIATTSIANWMSRR